MPQYYKPLRPQDDSRRKIMPEQYQEIREHYKTSHSQRTTAKAFGVSRRLIIFILYPERLKAFQHQRYQLKPWRKYYERESHTRSIAKLRAKKKKLNCLITKKEADDLGIHSN